MKTIEKELKILKALADPVRLKILSILSGGELCACSILDLVSVSQSTLSHHMKTLIECDLVIGRKDATWMYYSINIQTKSIVIKFIENILQEKPGLNESRNTEKGCKNE
jgi:ArsR family transcriptional regulator